MKRNLIIISILFSVIFAGCGKSAYNIFTHDENYYKTLENSSKGEIRDNFVTRAILSATYLNPIYPEYKDSEAFLVGVYIPKDFKEKEKQGLHNPFYKLTLSQENYYKIKEVEQDAEILKKSPLVDRWSLYYIIEFNKQNTEKLFLKFEDSEINQNLILTFETFSQK